jgi:hypothetical protein
MVRKLSSSKTMADTFARAACTTLAHGDANVRGLERRARHSRRRP